MKEYQAKEWGIDISESKFITHQISYNGINATFAKSSANLYEDAISRDFTMNALYFNLEDLSVIDPLGRGINDVQNKKVNICSQNSLEQDPFRILSAISMASNYDL
jgi:tRNA nucleotidyltransferase/poly(A) polymerase